MDNNIIGVVVLAAGKGKRMGNDSKNPKVLKRLFGQPMMLYVLNSIEQSNINTKPVVVIAPDLYIIRDVIGPSCEYAIQETQLGTGHAVLSAKNKLSRYQNVLVLYGDMPLIKSETINELIDAHARFNSDMTFATARVPSFDGEFSSLDSYGRIIRDNRGKVVRIVEDKDTTEEEKNIKDVNTGIYLFKSQWLWSVLPKVSRENAQNEYYLTDVLGIGIEQGNSISEVILRDPVEAIGINTPEQLDIAEQIIEERFNDNAKERNAKLPI